MPILEAYSSGLIYGGLACIALAFYALYKTLSTPLDPTRGHARNYIDYKEYL